MSLALKWVLLLILTLFPVLPLVVTFGFEEASAQECHASYSGQCVPVASDVDCARGRGNGPEYVGGPVFVVGYDEYDLDRDGDGIACER